VLTAGLMVAIGLVGAPLACPSCATAGRVSPYALIGTVISTQKKDHIATLITDNGQRVTVLGTERRVSEVLPLHDRRYALGGGTSSIRLTANRHTGTTSVPRLTNSLVRSLGRCRPRTIPCPTGFPSTNSLDLWDTCCSSDRLRQASYCLLSWVANPSAVHHSSGVTLRHFSVGRSAG
jgi:hypothetical protein